MKYNVNISQLEFLINTLKRPRVHFVFTLNFTDKHVQIRNPRRLNHVTTRLCYFYCIKYKLLPISLTQVPNCSASHNPEFLLRKFQSSCIIMCTHIESLLSRHHFHFYHYRLA